MATLDLQAAIVRLGLDVDDDDGEDFVSILKDRYNITHTSVRHAVRSDDATYLIDCNVKKAGSAPIVSESALRSKLPVICELLEPATAGAPILMATNPAAQKPRSTPPRGSVVERRDDHPPSTARRSERHFSFTAICCRSHGESHVRVRDSLPQHPRHAPVTRWRRHPGRR